MTKLQIISDKNKKSSRIKNILIKKINKEQFKKDNLIIVIGGDGGSNGGDGGSGSCARGGSGSGVSACISDKTKKIATTILNNFFKF